ncbi:E3 ubiquitin-protein ligase COP1 [Apostasia shenzhenica]|uniref:E3 ubiquitin-protein ligase COP1 n=1 Tax=Apostasia shenzhenica TaxID=1088818 RepID=A0A2H9ZUS1_9ASPA|nr:E3 ubiquitin-protein ligase COP1 [Apostasia shenzhenica]
MAVYYKFKSAKAFDSIPIEGQFISVANLKERIFESKQLGRGTDFDLMVSNAQTDEEYVDEAAMIPKNTSVLIRRVPGRPRNPIVTERDEPKVVENKVEDIPPSTSIVVGDSSTMKFPEESEWDEFGNDLYSIPDIHPAQSSVQVVDVSPAYKIDEESKIKALVDTPALDWNSQGHDLYGAGRGFGRGMGGRMMGGRGFGRFVLEKKTPPAGYVCHRCKIPGHFIQHCPTNGDPTYDIKRVKPPTGIPKSMLMATPEGSYALPSGAVAVLRPNEAAFEKEIEGLPSTRPISDLPPELRCPLCKEVMKDAVLTSKCCFKSFCDKCIRDFIINNSKCVCGATNILADDLLPNKTLRETINRILESATSSTENAGSLIQVQDMESARIVQPLVPSPAHSAASKDRDKPTPPELSDIKESLDVGSIEPKVDNVSTNLADEKHTKHEKIINPAETTPECTSAREVASAEVAPVLEEAQEKLPPGDQGKKKKKKKLRPPVSAADMQWRGFQDLGAENFTEMPLGPSAYNPYWAGGMPMGMDGYIPPFPGAMPFMGYTPGPFDVPFGGMLPHDPYAAQAAYMMPGFPQRDLADLGMSGIGMNQGPPVLHREDPRKAELRRKREMERIDRHSERRDRPVSKDRRGGSSTEPDRRTPPRTRKRRSTERHRDHDAAAPPACDEVGKADRKQKGSVFSRISFPAETAELTGGSDKSRKTSSDPPNGVKDHREKGRERDHQVANGYRSSSVGRSDRRSGGESSDEERHFKRRSSSRRESEKEREAEASRGSRGSRERDHRVQDLHEGKRR